MPSASITLTELIDSRTISSTDGKWSGARKFIAYRSDGEALSLSEVIRGAGLPKQTSKHPDQPIMEANGSSFAPIEDRAGAWACAITYAGGGPGTSSGNIAGHVSEQFSLSVKYVDVYRVGYTAPFGAVHDTEVNGKAADTAGHPISYPTPMVELRVVENVEVAPNLLYLSNSVAKRNAGTFGGAPARTVVYGGAATRKISDSIWQVSHVFHADFHMMHYRQKAKTDKDRNPEMGTGTDAGSSPAPNGEAFVETVRWVDPFPDEINMHSVLAYDPYGGA
jgi:hypothetical protein|tara:strand:- start:59 stop:895 length:837 start_codon:yes stop_codon:yes gene_type:complete